MALDKPRTSHDQQEIARTLKSNQEALQFARQKVAQYRRTLEISRAEVEEARRDLRRAGYLK